MILLTIRLTTQLHRASKERERATICNREPRQNTWTVMLLGKVKAREGNGQVTATTSVPYAVVYRKRGVKLLGRGNVARSWLVE